METKTPAGELARALSVLVLTPHIRRYLELTDPMALAQARLALEAAAPVAFARAEAPEIGGRIDPELGVALVYEMPKGGR